MALYDLFHDLSQLFYEGGKYDWIAQGNEA